jgi:hypothetical protein
MPSKKPADTGDKLSSHNEVHTEREKIMELSIFGKKHRMSISKHQFTNVVKFLFIVKS